MESGRLETRLGRLAWRSWGQGPTIVFFAGALANGDLWRDVIVALEDRYRCITVDLPLGAHPWVVLLLGEECPYFPVAHARRLASDFPRATLVPVPGAKTWVPVDNPAAVADAIARFVPTPA